MTSEYPKATPVGPEFLSSDRVNIGSYALGSPPVANVRKAFEETYYTARYPEGVWVHGYRECPEADDDTVFDALFDAFEVRPRETVTDAEVTSALRAFDEHAGPGSRASMRAALEAAREARRGV